MAIKSTFKHNFWGCSNLVRFALTLGAAALIAGCGGSEPIGLPGAAPRGSWMMPQARGIDLLYVSSKYSSIVYVYTFPGAKLVGGLSFYGNYSWGLCSNKKGHVFITAAGVLYEYPHGGASPIATLSDPQGPPLECSVDPTTGKVAAISSGGVAIFKPERNHRWHLARLYTLQQYPAYGGYDESGNLFVDGATTGGQFFIVELAAGGKAFESVSLDKRISIPGNIQWDGKYLAVGDRNDTVIDRFSIKGTKGTRVGALTLKGPQENGQFWIQGNIVIGPAFKKSSYYIGFWPYPGGGMASKTFSQSEAWGATVSVGHT